MEQFIRTELPVDSSYPVMEREQMVLHTLKRLHEDWKASRRGMEQHWMECWALYFGTKDAQDWLRSRALTQTVGNVGVDWRHHITQSKAYDLIETVIPYFKSASFPNEYWFDLIPTIPVPSEDLSMFLRILREFIKGKLDNANFKQVYEIYLRQLSVLGTSVVSMPWRFESKTTRKKVRTRALHEDEIQEIEVEKIIYNAPEMRVEDMFDIWLDPDSDDPNKADLIRRFTLRRGEIVRLINDGVYNKARVSDVKGMRAWKRGYDNEEQDTVARFHHAETSGLSTDVIEIHEFWGTLELPNEELYDIVATWSGNVLLRLESNPYTGGKPFVIGRYTPLPQSPYGWGMLSPIMGNLHELDILANSRLDGLEITLQPTFLLRNDGTTDPASVVAEPGRVIPVADVDGIKQLITNNEFSAVSMNEEQLREQIIERRSGTSSFVGTSPGRSGERVTAAEVEATQSAGGNRLSGIYEGIERESLLTIVQRVYDYCQQFQSYDEIVTLPGADPQQMMYATVGQTQLLYDMKVQPIGAKHIANKEYGIRQFTDWLAAMTSNEMLMAVVNWEQVAIELTRKFIEESPDRFINVGGQQQAAQSPVPPQGGGVGDAYKEVGGQELANAVNANMMADGGINFMAGAAKGLPGLPQNLTPNEQELATQYATAIPAANATGINFTAATNPPV